MRKRVDLPHVMGHASEGALRLVQTCAREAECAVAHSRLGGEVGRDFPLLSSFGPLPMKTVWVTAVTPVVLDQPAAQSRLTHKAASAAQPHPYPATNGREETQDQRDRETNRKKEDM